MSSNSFIGSGRVLKQKNRTGAIQLHNPTGSGVSAQVEAISVWRTSGARLLLMRLDIPFSIQGATMNKVLNGTMPKSIIYTNALIGQPSGMLVSHYYSPKNARAGDILAGLGHDRPIIMPPGTGLYVASDKKKVEIGAVWYWTEVET